MKDKTENRSYHATSILGLRVQDLGSGKVESEKETTVLLRA